MFFATVTGALALGTGISVAEEPARIAIYSHSGGEGSGPRNLMRILNAEPRVDAAIVSPEQIREGSLDNFDVLIMPGGSGGSQSRHLEEAGRQIVREYVRDGGGYVGICAGSYLASSHYDWSLSLINARVWDRVHWARGQGEVRLALTQPGRNLLQPHEDSVDGSEHVNVYYGQGPLLVPDDKADLPGYEVLASYESEVAKKGAPVGSMVGTHAIVRTKYGRGRVICYSPHPEKSGGPNEIMLAGILWSAGVGLETTSIDKTKSTVSLDD